MSRRYHRCDVIWAKQLFKADAQNRPYLVINNHKHPYADVDYIVLPLTLQEHAEGYRLKPEHWADGAPNKQGWVKPWTPLLLQPDDIDSRMGTLRDYVVDDIIDHFVEYYR